MKRSNTPLVVIIGILLLLFVVPFVLALIMLAIYGEFTLPSGLFVEGLLAELDANFVLALLLTVLPVIGVWLVESSRRRGVDQRRSLTLTLVMLVLVMAGVTAIPLISALRPLAGFPPGQAFAILAVVALPLFLIMLIAALLLPEARRHGDGTPAPHGRPEGNGA
ncbi:MAG TPA: hypothetical protein VKY39_05260 [Aggregatilineales bacterium]|nr:hypothetical protein [Aggregatilineales bacterium]